MRATRRRGGQKHVIKTIDDLFKQGQFDEIIRCRVPQLPATVDQKITFRSTNEGIIAEVEYHRKWWTKPVPQVVTVKDLDKDLFLNEMERFENLFCKKLN